MNKLIALTICLGLVSSASAALFTEDFSGDLSAWSGQDSGQVIVSGVLQDLDDTQEGEMSAALSSSASSGMLYLDMDLEADGGWARLHCALVDAGGNGIWINQYIGDTYFGGAMGITNDGGASGSGVGSDLDVVDTQVLSTLQYEINLDTGQLYAGSNLEAMSLKNTISMAGIGPITTIVLHTHKRLQGMDNINLIPEPATLALLAFGGLGVLIRRRR